MTAIDTNVLIYGCDHSVVEKQRVARQVVADSVGGVLLWQVACEFIAASRKLEGQGFFQLLDHVFASGEPFAGQEVPVEQRFFNFSGQPLRTAGRSNCR